MLIMVDVIIVLSYPLEIEYCKPQHSVVLIEQFIIESLSKTTAFEVRKHTERCVICVCVMCDVV